MNRRSTAVALASAVTLALGLAAGPAVAQTNLKWAHVYETSEPFHTQSVWAAEEIEKRTNGRYHIDVFPGLAARQGDGPQPGPDARQRRYHHLGLELRGAQLPADRRHLLPLHLPRRRSSPGLHQERRLQGAGARLPGQDRAPHRRGDLLRHASDHVEPAAAQLRDLQGLKMRVPDVPAYLAMPRACGANTAPIAFAEVYLALQNGTVEAQENPLTTIEAKKFYEVQKYIVLTGHIVDHLNTIISKSLWAKLSDEDRQDLHRGRPGGGRARQQADPGA